MESRKPRRVTVNDEFNFDDAWQTKPIGQPPPQKSNTLNSLSIPSYHQQQPPPPPPPTHQPQQPPQVAAPFVRTKPPLNKQPSVQNDEETYSDGRYSDDDEEMMRRGRNRGQDIYRRRVKDATASSSHSNHRSSKSKSSSSRSRDRGDMSDRNQHRESKQSRSREDRDDHHYHHHHHKGDHGGTKWESVETFGSEPPNDLTVTHVNQTRDLLVGFM
jgi:hypothetical protein